MPLDLFARTSTTPEDDCISAETVREINRAIESLPPKCREVFKLSYLEDLSNREISERLGISQSTVENHIYSALKQLRQKLSKEQLLLLLALLFMR